jgi:predicted O-methyltransferase YrrM
MNKLEHLAHNLHQASGKRQNLRRILESDFGKQTLSTGRQAVRLYYERFGVKGRFDEQASTEQLATESIRRGAMQKRSELAALLDRLKVDPPKTVLEIGTARGGMFFALAHIATADAHLISVDLPGGEFGGGYGRHGKDRLQSFMAPTQQATLIQGDSHMSSVRDRVTEALGDAKLDFLLIDGDHTAKGSRQDWEDYSGLVKPGGIVAFHDIAPKATDPRCEVPLVWADIKTNHVSIELIEPSNGHRSSNWGGLGLIILD